jgi:endoglucanase
MNAHPVTYPGRRFVITSIVRIATAIVVAGTLALTLAPLLAKGQSGSAFVRVNQVGYAATALKKRAYLMASGAEAGATFSVKNASGATVYAAPIGANLGTWSTSYPDVYALDFNSVTTPGTYTIVTSGPIVGSSPGFPIDTAANVYSGALSNALSFYQNERDGPNYIPSALRTAPGHLDDASAMTYLTPI